MSTNEDTLRSLGKLLAEGQGERDAVHIAIVPVVANEELKVGAAVGFVADTGRVGPSDHPVGIVDPFLQELWVQPGQRFWLYLTPGSITSLRHDWAHPAFPSREVTVAPGEAAESENWLRDFAREHRMTYEETVEGAASGNGACMWGDRKEDAQTDEFWRHVENVTGKRFDTGHRENTFFSCRC
jgi:hypothetical protein